MHPIPSHVRPSCKSFAWREASCLCFSFLSIFLMPNNYYFSLVINPLGKVVNYLFVCGHALGWLVYGASFCSCSFSCLTSFFLSFFLCLFPTLADDIHIFNLASLVPFIFNHFSSKLTLAGSVVQPCECTPWSPSNLPTSFTLPHGFCCLFDGMKILRVPFGSVLFSFSFL